MNSEAHGIPNSTYSEQVEYALTDMWGLLRAAAAAASVSRGRLLRRCMGLDTKKRSGAGWVSFASSKSLFG